MGRVIDSLTGPLEEQRHPVLMNTMYMWACFMSRPDPLCQHEEHYLGLALDALPEGLRNGEKIIDVIQGSCLLSTYFLANGRVIEGSYHASAAAALAVQCGLHLNPLQEELCPWESQDSYDMKPSRVGMQEGEKILAFWQVYNLDRCWSVILRKPSVIPDNLNSRYSINCPWPQDLAHYEVVRARFVSASPSGPPFSSRVISMLNHPSKLSRGSSGAKCLRVAFQLKHCEQRHLHCSPVLMKSPSVGIHVSCDTAFVIIRLTSF